MVNLPWWNGLRVLTHSHVTCFHSKSGASLIQRLAFQRTCLLASNQSWRLCQENNRGGPGDQQDQLKLVWTLSFLMSDLYWILLGTCLDFLHLINYCSPSFDDKVKIVKCATLATIWMDNCWACARRTRHRSVEENTLRHEACELAIVKFHLTALLLTIHTENAHRLPESYMVLELLTISQTHKVSHAHHMPWKSSVERASFLTGTSRTTIGHILYYLTPPYTHLPIPQSNRSPLKGAEALSHKHQLLLHHPIMQMMPLEMCQRWDLDWFERGMLDQERTQDLSWAAWFSAIARQFCAIIWFI